MLIMPCAILTMPDGDDRGYMEQLYRRHYRLMYATAWKFVSDASGADDIVSDSCLALIQKVDTLRSLPERPLRAYIVKTVRNTALNFLSRSRRTAQRFSALPDEEYCAASEQTDTERKILLQDELDRVWAAIENLPEREKLVMQLKYDNELTNEEIADRVGLSVDSIDKYIRRARKRIRNMVYSEE